MQGPRSHPSTAHKTPCSHDWATAPSDPHCNTRFQVHGEGEIRLAMLILRPHSSWADQTGSQNSPKYAPEWQVWEDAEMSRLQELEELSGTYVWDLERVEGRIPGCDGLGARGCPWFPDPDLKLCRNGQYYLELRVEWDHLDGVSSALAVKHQKYCVHTDEQEKKEACSHCH